jgi:hypothetical protein
MYVSATEGDSYGTYSNGLGDDCEVLVRWDRYKGSTLGSGTWPIDVEVNGNGTEVHMAFTLHEAEEIARGILALLEQEVVEHVA